jgi:P4 family phage/plasmid primase-like protien
MFEIKLESVKSCLHNIKLFEIYNKTAINQLLDSDLLMTKPHAHILKAKYETEKEQIKEYIKQSKDIVDIESNIEYAMATVLYKKANGYTFGRVYPVGSLSMCTLRRQVRQTIAKVKKDYPMYIDIDVKNCHPEIVYQYMKNNEIECKILKEYINNRSKVLEEIQKEYNVSYEQSKNLMIRLLYFGGFENWAKDNKLTKAKPTKFITNFIEEREIYGKIITDNNDEIVLEVQKNKTKKNIFEYNESSSVVSIWCQEIENRIIEEIYKYSVKNKLIRDKETVLCYDGIMLLNQNESGKIYWDYEVEDICDKFSKLVKDKFGLDLKYVNKSMDEDYHDQLNDKIEEIKEANKPDDDSKFFEELKTMSHQQCAKIYYDLNKDKYTYSNKSGWYEYNEYNVLINTGIEYPLTIKLNVSKTLTDYLIPIRNRMKPNKLSYVNDSKLINKLLKDINNSSFANGIKDYLKELYINNDIDSKIDNNGNLIAFTNKLYDYTTCTIRDIKKEDYISKTTRYEYKKSDPQIKKEIIKIIKSIFEDDKIYNYIMHTKSSALFGNLYESAYIYIGNGGNGKGLISGLDNALGDYVMTSENTFITSAFKQGSANPTLSSAKGVRVLYVSEPAECDEFGKEVSINTPFLKLITGNDDITTRNLYQGNITYKPLFTPFILCNHTPNIKKIDGGIKRRIKMIQYKLDFVSKPEKENQRLMDAPLKKKLENVKYYREYLLLLLEYATTNKDKAPIIPEEVEKRTEEYFTENNPVKIFLDKFINIEDKKTSKSKIRTSDLKDYYEDHMECKITPQNFIKSMGMNGIENSIMKGYKYFKYISYKQIEEDDEE